jgi:hypothetical protein
MEFCKKIDGERWSLSQDRTGQITIKKENDIVFVKKMNRRLDTKAAFAMLSKAPNMKLHPIHTVGVETKLNKETEEEKMETKIVEKLTPHKCVFCNTEPKVVTTKNDVRECRELRCKCFSRSDETFEKKYATRWVYSVDITNGGIDEADNRLISEWNARMPIINK